MKSRKSNQSVFARAECKSAYQNMNWYLNFPPITLTILFIFLAYPNESKAQENMANNQLSTIVVTSPRENNYDVRETSIGTKFDIPLKELPQSAQIITAEMIRDQGLTSLQDVMKNISGTNPTGPIPAQAWFWTGFNIRGFQVGPLTDGLPTTYGAASRATDLMVNIERIDVLKGPAAVAYGASQDGSLGGVINLVTKQPLAIPRHEVGFTVDRYGSLSPSFDVTGPLNEDKTILFRVTGQQDDRKTFIDQNGRTSKGIFPTLTFTNHRDTSLTLQAEYTERNVQYYPGLPYTGTVDTSSYALPISRNYNEPGNYRKTTFETMRATLKHQLNSEWSLEMIALRFRGVEAYAGADILEVNSDNTINRRFIDSRETDEDKTIDLRLRGRTHILGLENNLLIGFQRQDYMGHNNQLEGGLTPINLFQPNYGATPTNFHDLYPPYVDHSVYSGLYIQDQLALTPALKFLFGARYNSIKDDIKDGFTNPNTSTQELTPSLGATYAITNSVSLFAGYSRGVTPAWCNCDPAGPSPKAQRSRQYEAGVKLALSNDLSANFAVFNLEHLNAPISQGVYSIQVGKERSTGFEADLTGGLTRNLNLTAAYGYTQAKVIIGDGIPTGDRLQNNPVNSGRLFAVYRFNNNGPLAGLRVGGGAYYASEREATLPNSVKLPGYTTLDAMASYELSKGSVISLNLHNLSNRRYYENAIFNRYYANAIYNHDFNVLNVQPGAPFNAVLNYRITY